VEVGPTRTVLNVGDYAALSAGSHVRIGAAAGQPGWALLIAGEPINEPIVRHGPFVMNTQQQIRQAFEDYHSGHFGEIEGSTERFRLTEQAVSKQKETGRW
jgi:redox-sensitive bicupin YhaK (pirin superfamily)